MKEQEEDYQPFGEEWKAEIRKMKKEMIIELYAASCQKRKAIESQLEECQIALGTIAEYHKPDNQ